MTVDGTRAPPRDGASCARRDRGANASADPRKYFKPLSPPVTPTRPFARAFVSSRRARPARVSARSRARPGARDVRDRARRRARPRAAGTARAPRVGPRGARLRAQTGALRPARAASRGPELRRDRDRRDPARGLRAAAARDRGDARGGASPRGFRRARPSAGALLGATPSSPRPGRGASPVPPRLLAAPVRRRGRARGRERRRRPPRARTRRPRRRLPLGRARSPPPSRAPRRGGPRAPEVGDPRGRRRGERVRPRDARRASDRRHARVRRPQRRRTSSLSPSSPFCAASRRAPGATRARRRRRDGLADAPNETERRLDRIREPATPSDPRVASLRRRGDVSVSFARGGSPLPTGPVPDGSARGAETSASAGTRIAARERELFGRSRRFAGRSPG